MRTPTLLLLALTASTHALTFTSPLPGTTIDLTSPLQITWIPSSSDPSTFTLTLVNTLSGSSDEPQTLATTLRTRSTSYTLPANSISSYGSGFEIQATDSSGDSFASSGEFSAADGVYTLQTATDGVLTIVTSSTQGSASSSTAVLTSSSTSGSGASAASSSTAQGSASSTTKTIHTTASTTASPQSSSTRASSTPTKSTPFSSSSSSSSPTSTSAAATSSSSDSNSNLGFDSAASAIRGRVGVSCAAFVGALVLAMVAY